MITLYKENGESCKCLRSQVKIMNEIGYVLKKKFEKVDIIDKIENEQEEKDNKTKPINEKTKSEKTKSEKTKNKKNKQDIILD